MVTKQDIERALEQGERENALFRDKSALAGPAAPVGRGEKAGELARAIAGGLKKGYAPPFVFVYGRTGSGKTTVAEFACSLLPVSYRVVNLRRARTAYGCASLILAALGGRPGSGQTIESMIEGMYWRLLGLAAKKPLALVLDEFDALFTDRRGGASDFCYRLLDVQARLKEDGCLVCVVAISNSVAAAEELDDRVRSRIAGAPEVFFDAYSKEEIVAILQDRAARALGNAADGVIEYIAEKSSQEHGDARRAIGLLGAAAEIAGACGAHAVRKVHVDAADKRLRKERVQTALERMSYHAKVACGGLARIAYLAPELGWYPTSVLYRQYCACLQKDVRPLGYRRVSELLMELENLGLAASRAGSRGRRGYGREYRLAMPPQVVGESCFPGFWGALEKEKESRLALISMYESQARDASLADEERARWRVSEGRARGWWKEFVGL